MVIFALMPLGEKVWMHLALVKNHRVDWVAANLGKQNWILMQKATDVIEEIDLRHAHIQVGCKRFDLSDWCFISASKIEMWGFQCNRILFTNRV